MSPTVNGYGAIPEVKDTLPPRSQRLIAAGRLGARKLGTKTLITAESIYRLIAELPLAQVRGRD
jgi:hypothetical protein